MPRRQGSGRKLKCQLATRSGHATVVLGYTLEESASLTGGFAFRSRPWTWGNAKQQAAVVQTREERPWAGRSLSTGQACRVFCKRAFACRGA